VAILIIVTILVVSGGFTTLWAKGTGNLKQQGNIENPDNDDVMTIFDKCPCDYGEEENQGCPEGPIPEKPDRSCLDD